MGTGCSLRVHQDQGSENKGEHAEALGDSNIVKTSTHRDWHQGKLHLSLRNRTATSGSGLVSMNH